MSLLGGIARTPAQRYNDVPSSLMALDRALSQRQYRRCNLVAVGDSLYEGSNAATYRGSFVPQFADAMRARFPVSGQGGGGFTGGLDTIHSAWSIEGGAGPQDFIPSTTGTVTKSTGATAALGMGRRSIQLSAGATMTFPSNRFTGFDIETANPVSSGTSYTYDIDGGAPVSVTTSTTRATLTAATNIGDTVLPVSAVPADWYPGVQLSVEVSGGQIETAYIASISGLNVTLTAPLANTHASAVPVGAHSNGGYITAVRSITEASHVLRITAATALTLLAVDFYLNDDDRGVHVFNAGHAGIRADQLESTAATDHWVQSVVARKPDAILSNLIINDSGAQTTAAFIQNLTDLRARINSEMAARFWPQPSWVQTLPYEVTNATGRFGGVPWATYVDAVHGWAAADTSGPGGKSGIYVVDGSRLMPRSDAATTGYFDADKVHYTSAGAAKWASRVANALPVNGTLA
jgi:lysophospholipase L1-like esterase